MLRYTVLAVAIVYCNSFCVPQVPVRFLQRVHTHRTCDIDESQVLIRSHVADESTSQRPLTQEATPSTQSEVYTRMIDRRTLLKIAPATLAAGIVGLGAASEQAVSAHVSPKADAAGAKVVVLGGSGFVGSRVCEMLVEAGEASL